MRFARKPRHVLALSAMRADRAIGPVEALQMLAGLVGVSENRVGNIHGSFSLEPRNAASRSLRQVYNCLNLIQSPGRNEPDDRVCSIEITFSDPVPFSNNLLAVCVPHTHWKDGDGAPWLQDLRSSNIDILPYNFIPGRHPEFYQTMMESQVRAYYFEKSYLP